MLENLLAIQPSGSQYRYTGPGPEKLVAGTMALGYFGICSASEINVNTADFTAIAGTIVNSTCDYLKFARDDKILYIAMAAYKNQVKWYDVYTSGYAFGSDNFGWNHTYTSGVNQNRRITRTDNRGAINVFKPRLPYGIGNLNPSGIPLYARFNEIHEFFLRVTNGEWDSLTLDRIQMSVAFNQKGGWAMTLASNTMSGNVHGYSSHGGNDSVMSSSGGFKEYTYGPIGFRPVLELIPGDGPPTN